MLLLIVSFVVKKLFRLVLSHWLIFVFVAYTFDIASPRKLFPRSVSSFLPVFSSRNVVVLGLTFKPSIFELRFVNITRCRLIFILFHVIIHFPHQDYYFKWLLLLYLVVLVPML